MMGTHLDRAWVLFEQSRHDLAEEELRRELADDPNSPDAHALLGLCLAERGRFADATREAIAAVQFGPDVSFAHHVLASVLQDCEKLRDAQSAAEEAVRLDPDQPNHRALLASIRLERGMLQEALEAAEQGLRLDAEHVACANLRAMVLAKLGRQDEAGDALSAVLARDPGNAVTHANRGWALLQQARHEKAFEHFREALRLDPEFSMARQGLVASLKTRYRPYRLLLSFFLWMSRLSPTAQWGLIGGGVVGYWLLLLLTREDALPQLRPLIWPVLLSFLGFGILTWLADPLFSLCLRLNPSARLALSPDQVAASNGVGLCLLGSVVLMVGWLVACMMGIDWLTERRAAFLVGAAVVGLLALPVAGTFGCPTGWRRSVMAGYTAALVAAALSSVGLMLYGKLQPVTGTGSIGAFLAAVAALGAFLSGWVTIGLIAVRSRH